MGGVATPFSRPRGAMSALSSSGPGTRQDGQASDEFERADIHPSRLVLTTSPKGQTSVTRPMALRDGQLEPAAHRAPRFKSPADANGAAGSPLEEQRETPALDPK